MIDITAGLYDELARLVLAEFPGAYVRTELTLSPAAYPAVFIEQSFSSEVDSVRDSSGEEQTNAIIWTVNIYSNSDSDPKQECKHILSIIDARMRLYNFKRLTARFVNNLENPEITRYVGRFTGLVDKYGLCYWR